MSKNKRPVPRKSHTPAEEDDDVLAKALADLALAVAEAEGDDEEDVAGTPADLAALQAKEVELARLIRNSLRKKNDDVLYGAIERARYDDVGAYQLLRSRIEEAAGSVLIRREGAPAQEIDAFALPIFVHSTGGLRQAEDFADSEAFDQLVASFQAAGLESPSAKVVLISHGYDLEEVDRITYSHLQDMVRDAAASMTEKKLVARPALERSLSGWADSAFGPDDAVVELRFLLGFALKAQDDPFYQVPQDEVAVDAYFEQRMQRYRDWTVQATPLVKRCLTADPESIELHFLYQDLFFGAKEQGVAEMETLKLMSDISEALQRGAANAADVHAVAGPAALEDELVLRVKLFDVAGTLLASIDKPLDVAADLESEVDDVCDALSTVGVQAISVCLRFDTDGQAIEAQAWSAG